MSCPAEGRHRRSGAALGPTLPCSTPRACRTPRRRCQRRPAATAARAQQARALCTPRVPLPSPHLPSPPAAAPVNPRSASAGAAAGTPLRPRLGCRVTQPPPPQAHPPRTTAAQAARAPTSPQLPQRPCRARRRRLPRRAPPPPRPWQAARRPLRSAATRRPPAAQRRRRQQLQRWCSPCRRPCQWGAAAASQATPSCPPAWGQLAARATAARRRAAGASSS